MKRNVEGQGSLNMPPCILRLNGLYENFLSLAIADILTNRFSKRKNV